MIVESSMHMSKLNFCIQFLKLQKMYQIKKLKCFLNIKPMLCWLGCSLDRLEPDTFDDPDSSFTAAFWESW